MKRIGILIAVLGLACGSVNDKTKCASSLDCATGETCISAEGEQRCWPDSVPPSVQTVSATCATPCLRDGIVHVEATATDDHEVLDASVALDLDPSAPVAMARSGAKWVADVPLRTFPFEAFERAVTASVTVRDGAKTPSQAVAATPVQVTRLRWTYDAGVSMTSPAVMTDGTAVVGLAKNTEQLLAVGEAGVKAWALTVGTGSIVAAPAIGGAAIWVGSSDGNLYGASVDGTAVLEGVGVASGGAIQGSVATRTVAAAEWAFGTASNGRFVAASATGASNSTSMVDSFTAGPVLNAAGRIFGATDVLNATTRCYDFDGAFTGDRCTPPQNNPSLGDGVFVPIVVDILGSVWTVSIDRKLSRTDPQGATTVVIGSLPARVDDSPVIASNGDIILGDQGGALRRYTSTGAPAWTTPPNLGSSVLAPMILSGTSAPFVVPTKGGSVFAIRADGTKAWDGALASTELRAGNLYTPPGQPAGGVLSTAYFAGSNGKLYAVIVDGQLDTAAPWPKAFHDPRNTSNAGTAP